MPRDAALVDAALAGREHARKELFVAYAAIIQRLASRLIGSGADAEDLVQESFMHAFATLPRLEDHRLFGPWLYSIVVRTAHKTLRRRRQSRRFVNDEGSGLYRQPAGRASRPDVALEAKLACLAIDELPPALREPLLLQRLDGLQLACIAQALDISLATLKRRIAHATSLVESAIEGAPQPA